MDSTISFQLAMIDQTQPAALKAHHYLRRAFSLHEMFMLVELSVSYLLAVLCSWTRIWEAAMPNCMITPWFRSHGTRPVLCCAGAFVSCKRISSHLLPSHHKPDSWRLVVDSSLKKIPPPRSIRLCSERYSFRLFE